MSKMTTTRAPRAPFKKTIRTFRTYTRAKIAADKHGATVWQVCNFERAYGRLPVQLAPRRWIVYLVTPDGTPMLLHRISSDELRSPG